MGEIANVTNHIMFPIDEVVATLIIEHTSMTGPIPARSIALIAIRNPHFAELVAARATPLLTPAALHALATDCHALPPDSVVLVSPACRD